ncbi:hypothetical protein F5Y04DRAFT_287105 [Hypomontagnella monticulosa]|nr:hypothetical protein F5Y04DRAFT_287105 [Hypomontagnella monticulosa]
MSTPASPNTEPGQGSSGPSSPPLVETTLDESDSQTPEAIGVEHFGTGEFSDWLLLMDYLGFVDEFTTIVQCQDALHHVWVNIVDFLEDITFNCRVRRFSNEHELSEYTKRTQKFYPKDVIPEYSPLRGLLASIIKTREQRIFEESDWRGPGRIPPSSSWIFSDKTW